jgi:hypothetical protein
MWKPRDVNDNGEWTPREHEGERSSEVMLPTFVKLYPTPRACEEGGEQSDRV